MKPNQANTQIHLKRKLFGHDLSREEDKVPTTEHHTSFLGAYNDLYTNLYLEVALQKL